MREDLLCANPEFTAGAFDAAPGKPFSTRGLTHRSAMGPLESAPIRYPPSSSVDRKSMSHSSPHTRSNCGGWGVDHTLDNSL